MNVIHRRGWEIPDRLATSEHFVFNRRSFVAAGVSALTLSPLGATAKRLSDVAKLPDPSADLYPAKRNEKYVLDRAITNEKVNGNYNNFYEFGTSKSIAAAAQALPIRPWTVKIDGMVEKPMEVGIDDLIRKLHSRSAHTAIVASKRGAWQSPGRVSRLPSWSSSRAHLALRNTFAWKRSRTRRWHRQRQPWYPWYPWPYVEGVTMAEATNELAFLATGAYGHPLARQHGAPLRLALPWKYGFKSIKSIVRFSFTDKRPKGLWEALQPAEYGF